MPDKSRDRSRRIAPIPGSTVNGPFILTGTCESGLDVVITGGSNNPNYGPVPVTVSCSAGIYSVELTPTGGVGQTVIIKSIQQIDTAGNISNPLSATYIIGGTRIITITGPSGTALAGGNTITGACDSGRTVTINGTGITPSSGTTPCTSGTYSYAVTITGNTSFSACQQYLISSGGGEPTIEYNCAYGGTTLPVNGGGGGGGSVGCIYPGGCTSSSSSTTSTPVVIPVTSNPISSIDNLCPKFRQYIRKGNIDGKNGITEVSKVQLFLNRHLGISIPVDGIFGNKTYQAVSSFQANHFAQILAPWKLSSATGWWYQSTRSYANYIEGCSEGVIELDNSIQIKDGEILQ